MLSAQAAINTERPWLVVTWQSDTKTPGLFRFGGRNQGNTTARVISVSAAVRFVNRITDLETPPDYSHPVAAPDLNIIVHQLDAKKDEIIVLGVFHGAQIRT